MPQLSIETFVSQYFWLILIFLIFYYVIITQILPNIAKILKTRNKAESTGPELETAKLKDDVKISLKNYKIAYLNELNNNVISEIEKAKTNWINKNVRNNRKST